MQISVSVADDEQRLRRTIRFLLRPQLKLIRVLGGVIIVLGLVLVALKPTAPPYYGALLLGLLFVFAVGPFAVARSMRVQSTAIRDGFHLRLDDECLTVSYPLVESRFRWAGLGRVIETAEVWYIMFGKLQAVTIPKAPMTEEQRAEFAAFVNGLPAPTGDRRPPVG